MHYLIKFSMNHYEKFKRWSIEINNWIAGINIHFFVLVIGVAKRLVLAVTCSQEENQSRKL